MGTALNGGGSLTGQAVRGPEVTDRNSRDRVPQWWELFSPSPPKFMMGAGEMAQLLESRFPAKISRHTRTERMAW